MLNTQHLKSSICESALVCYGCDSVNAKLYVFWPKFQLGGCLSFDRQDASAVFWGVLLECAVFLASAVATKEFYPSLLQVDPCSCQQAAPSSCYWASASQQSSPYSVCSVAPAWRRGMASRWWLWSSTLLPKGTGRYHWALWTVTALRTCVYVHECTC